MRSELPSASLCYCFQTVTLDFLWFEANHDRWFGLMRPTVWRLCAAPPAVCCFCLALRRFLTRLAWIHCVAFVMLKFPEKLKSDVHLQMFSCLFALFLECVMTPWTCVCVDTVQCLYIVRWTCDHVFVSLKGGPQLNVNACHSTFWLMKVISWWMCYGFVRDKQMGWETWPLAISAHGYQNLIVTVTISRHSGCADWMLNRFAVLHHSSHLRPYLDSELPCMFAGRDL